MDFPPGFEWDPAKNASNVRKHGIGFRDAVRIFDGPTLDRVDRRRDYGEERVNSIGDLDGRRIVVVTHTDRLGMIRVISARGAETAERRRYREHLRVLAGEPAGRDGRVKPRR